MLSSLVLMLHSRTARLVSMLIGIALVGALGYMVLEGWSFSEAMYMTSSRCRLWLRRGAITVGRGTGVHDRVDRGRRHFGDVHVQHHQSCDHQRRDYRNRAEAADGACNRLVKGSLYRVLKWPRRIADRERPCGAWKAMRRDRANRG